MALDNHGDIAHVKGSATKPYELKNTHGVISCSCPAWRNQSIPTDRRTCKHIKKVRGEVAEAARLGADPHTLTQVATTAEMRADAAHTKAAEHAAQGKKLRPDEKARLFGAPVLLANKYNFEFDPTGWWVSEKLDGVRAYWDGQQFVSRQGNVFHAPNWFREGLPSFPLDGELWVGRQQFQKTISIVRQLDAGEAWRQVSYVLFDRPVKAPFEQRLAEATTWCFEARLNGMHHVRVLEHERVESRYHLEGELRRIVRIGGEGLMLRQPGSFYEVGRSSTLLKVKPFQDDEATILEHVPGKGRHRGRLGGVVVRMQDGTTFNVGTGFTDAQRESPPPVGTTITFRYTEKTNAGVPKCASFVRVREAE